MMVSDGMGVGGVECEVRRVEVEMTVDGWCKGLWCAGKG
jgi:hypothetical protein